MSIKQLTAPFDKSELAKLRAGDMVEITGSIIVARDAAHQKMYQNYMQSGNLAFDLNGECVYYMGPSPAKKGAIIGAAGPTTSGRMDAYTPFMLETAGINAMIGKGYRSSEVIEVIKRTKAVYFVAIGGAGALMSESIKKYEVLAYPELGAEALARIWVENFPAIVAIDRLGENFYEIGQREFRQKFLGSENEKSAKI